jgi:hypothetical protein
MASDFATHAARQPAPSAISAEEVQALRVELQAQREVSARQARQIEALLAKLGLAEEGT